MSVTFPLVKSFAPAFLCLLISGPVRGQTGSAQQISADRIPRLLFDTKFGSERQLGYKFPSTSFGVSTEIPVSTHLEFQIGTAYSPDRKAITNDGHSFNLSGGAIIWPTRTLGVSGGIEQSWLRTSKFNKSALIPSAGVVLRNDLFGPGRLYLTYIFPTGCVWATLTNPCTIQSNRLQGLQIREEGRMTSRLRFGLESGVYHFCSQSNPFQRSAGRNCHFAVTMLIVMRFELHRSRRSLSELEGY
jgi:hypothetical protein